MAEPTAIQPEDAEILAVLEDDVFGESGEPRAIVDTNNNYGCHQN